MSLKNIISNDTRVSLLRQHIKRKKCIRLIEVHNGLSGLIANDVRVKLDSGDDIEFDGFWESSLTDSASKGIPDIEVVSIDSRLETIHQILEVTNKPMIVDGDTGGDFNQFEYMVKRLERAGVSGVIIEDKIFPKRNSLEAGARQDLEKVEIFAEKIRRGSEIKLNKDFMIISRLESLIAGHSVDEAIERAKTFLKAGADGVMIHSKSSDPSDIFEFAKRFYKFPKKLIDGKVLVCVPTTYNTILGSDFEKAGFNIIIHANHLLRASYKAMTDVSRKILMHDRSFEVDSDIASVKQIFEKVGFLAVTKKDEQVAYILRSKIKAIIPAAGQNQITKKMNLPISMVKIKGKTILEQQVSTLLKSGIDNIVVIKGFQESKFTIENIKYVINKNYNKYHLLHSLFCASDELNGPFIYANGDILFNQNIINSLLSYADDQDIHIILVVDNSYAYHKPNIDKKLDLVRTNKGVEEEVNRQVVDMLDEEVLYIGKKLDPDIASYEFVGIAYFSAQGAKILNEVYNSIKGQKGKFQEASDVASASFTDIIQEIVDRKYPVKVLKTYKGWMEVHSEDDIKHAERFIK